MGKQKIIIGLAFLIGLSLGSLLTWISVSKNDSPQLVETKIEEKIITKKVTDTVVVQKIVPTTISKKESNDSIDYGASKDTSNSQSNSLLGDKKIEIDTNLILNSEAIPNIDTTKDENDEEIVIISERLVNRRTVKVTFTTSETEEPEDKIAPQAERFSENMVVEFWDSPLELTGYELSKNKLKLYGFNPNDIIRLSHDSNYEHLVLRSGQVELNLVKTNRFQSLNF